jgi:hypothetical protein
LAVAAAAALAGCGSAGTFANRPRPAIPVNLTVYVNDRRVSVSPASVGAGPVQFVITNQASHNESVLVQTRAGASLADTGPINPGATAQVTVDFARGGDYAISTGAASTEQQFVGRGGIRPATLHIGSPRPSASEALLQP